MNNCIDGYCTISCSALISCIETVSLKIILWSYQRDEIRNCDTSELKKKFPMVLAIYYKP